MSAQTKVTDKTFAAGQATPGTQGGKVIDAPPAILTGGGPRDALVDPMPGDIIPDLETKGLHTGIVAQPAQPVSVDGVTVAGFVSGQPSRFQPFAELKRSPHRDEANLGVPASPDPSPAVRMLPGVGPVDTAALYGGGPKPEAAAAAPAALTDADRERHAGEIAARDAEIERLQRELEAATKPADADPKADAKS